MLATVLAFAAPLGWPFELFSHFRAQYLVAAALLAVLLLVVRRPGAAAVAGVLAGLHALPALQRSVAEDPVAACGGPAFTVVTANLQYSNHDTSRFLDWLAANPADLVVLQEVTGAWAATLSQVSAYPQRDFLVREDPYGIGVMSRWPLRSVERRDFAGDGLPSLSGGLVIQGQPVRFLALHTHWPILPGLAASRDHSLDAAAALVRAGDGPAAVLGDLNLTAYSPVFARFLESAGLRDASGRTALESDVDGGLLAARATDRSRARHARPLRRACRGRPLDRFRSSAPNRPAPACFARDSLTRRATSGAHARWLRCRRGADSRCGGSAHPGGEGLRSTWSNGDGSSSRYNADARSST